jgi:hypothetical protein
MKSTIVQAVGGAIARLFAERVSPLEARLADLERQVNALPPEHKGVLPLIEFGREYPRGTIAAHAGGLVRATRNTDPMKSTADFKDYGWEVLLAGVERFDFEFDHALAALVVRQHKTGGEQDVRVISIPLPTYVGVWDHEKTYPRGCFATHSGCLWHCDRAAAGQPGTPNSGWTMAVKRGRDARGTPVRLNEHRYSPVVKVAPSPLLPARRK